MRASLKTTAAVSLAILTLAVSAISAQAKPWPHPGHWHHGFGWGPGLALGILGAAVAADVASESCLREQPVYDAYGHYIGSRTINVCY